MSRNIDRDPERYSSRYATEFRSRWNQPRSGMQQAPGLSDWDEDYRYERNRGDRGPNRQRPFESRESFRGNQGRFGSDYERPYYERGDVGEFDEPAFRKSGYGFEEEDFIRRRERFGEQQMRDRWGYEDENYAGRGPRGYRRSEDRIRDEVCEELTRTPEIDASDIEVSVENTEVTLTGNVSSRRAKRRAEQLAEEVPGVRDVHNHLRVRQSFVEVLMGGTMHCDELMSTDLTVCTTEDSVHTVAQMMKQEDVGPIPVVDSRETNRLVGIVTDRDIVVRVVAEGLDPAKTAVGTVMTRDPMTVHPEDDARRALQIMKEHQVRRVPVVDIHNRIAGIIAQADVARRTGERRTGDVVEEISETRTGRKGH